jgi:NADH-quinone oxidoreductase subunit L
MSQQVWLIPLFPLIGFLIIGLLNRNLNKTITTIIGCGSILVSFVVAVLILIEKLGNPIATNVKILDWISVGNIHVSMSFLVDSLSAIFLIIITGIGFLIHVYSSGYMSHDDGYRRFFAYLNLFVFFMLLLVLGDNFLVMFVGWEGVGLCSYLLIGFWFKNKDYSSAAKKAFVMNRIGDLGFLLGIFMIFSHYGSIDYATVFSGKITIDTATVTIIAILLFIGAMGKSAQLPLFTWLPDAMAGPTPVSALIHAATMVTAGIYMVVRANVLFSASPQAMLFISIIGAATALISAVIGLFQYDIKKVLAYSTVSQLGLIFIGLGCGAFNGGIFHVLTHAFFKALLFLGAGSVIHAMSNEQDIRSMGGLRKVLPITHITFLIACLAIAGIPPLSGFFSKDEILIHVIEHNPVLGGIAILVSLMTAFYIFRLYFLTFSGDFRGNEHQKSHLHESPSSMTFPLIVLAFFSICAGWIGLPEVFGHNYLQSFLSPVIAAGEHTEPNHTLEYGLMIGMTLAASAIIFYCYKAFGNKTSFAAETEMTGITKIGFNKFYVDELYHTAITNPMNSVSKFFKNIFEKKIVDGAVNSVGTVTNQGGQFIKFIQNGNVDYYLFAMVIGFIAMILVKLI